MEFVLFYDSSTWTQKDHGKVTYVTHDNECALARAPNRSRGLCKTTKGILQNRRDTAQCNTTEIRTGVRPSK